MFFVQAGEDDLVRALLGDSQLGNGSAQEFEEHLKSLLQDDPVAMAEFEKLTAAAPGWTIYHH